MQLNINQHKLSEICERNAISYLGLFGSYAREEEVKTSDVDLLVRFGKEVSLLDHIKAENDLEHVFEKKSRPCN